LTIYVDHLSEEHKPGGHWPYPSACHLFADTSAELQWAAVLLRLYMHQMRERGTPEEHFLLNSNKRIEAIRLGAIPDDRGAFQKIVAEKRERAQGEHVN
jgi:hypothetical protein